MSRQELAALMNDTLLSLDELCRAGAVDTAWVRERVNLGALTAVTVTEEHWLFEPEAVERVRRIWRIERDFDAVPELAALVADLEAEIHRLRARLLAAGLV